MSVPELLTALSGQKIETQGDWEQFRRPEIKTLLETYAYGKRPVERPEVLTFSVVKNEEKYCGRDMTFSEIRASFPGYAFTFYGFCPTDAVNVKSFVYIMHENMEKKIDFRHVFDHPYLPIARIIERGYALFVMPTIGIYPEWTHHADFREGVIAHFAPERDKRRGDDWGSLSAWGWGASRVLDYIETDPRFDKTNTAVVGLSRSGKAALIGGAWDERFRLVISNASGCMGASLLRDRVGEHIKNLDWTDWFCDNLKDYREREEMYPVDQHFLLAMIAPRLLYVQSCTDDEWADPRNERLAAVLAGEVYEKIYGKTGAVLPPEEELKPDTPYHEGTIGYHITTGEHGTTPIDWEMYMDFWEKHC